MERGDIVVLKSGGPHMTASHKLVVDGPWCCVWFDESNKLCEGYFFEEVLDLYEDIDDDSDDDDDVWSKGTN